MTRENGGQIKRVCVERALKEQSQFALTIFVLLPHSVVFVF